MRTLEELQTSEIRYRRLFESARDGILILDAKTRKITDVNPFMIELLGYNREEFLGKELWEIGLLKDEAASAAAFKELQENHYIRYDDLPLETKDGECREVEFVSNVYKEDDDQVVQCNIRDITERLKGDAALRESKEHLALAQRVGKMGSFEWNIALNSLITSSTFEKLYDVPQDSFRDDFDGWVKFVHPEDREYIKQKFETALAKGNFDSEFRIIKADGEIRWIYAKGEVFRDVKGNPERMVGVNMDITERKQSELILLESENRFRAIFDNAAMGIALVNLEGKTFMSNPALQQMLGYSEDELLQMPITQITHPEDIEKDLALAAEAFQNKRDYYQIEKRYLKKNGEIMWAQLTGSAVNNKKGELQFGIGMIEDITSRKILEEQLLQSQKLESVGMLAGGIAHDFNNMLTAINGYSDMTLRKLEEDDPLRRNIEEIRKAGVRSADLTKQLLAFSRQQILKPIVINLNEVIADTTKLLQRLIGEDVQLTTTLNPKVGRVKVDPGQFSQIVMNLAVNARDAMPQGGQLTIETSNIFLDSGYTRLHMDILPGAYVMLAVSDTGSGMTDQIKKHIFEPFFTTKEIGQGTGLGLSTVYGIVKQSGGSIEVYSEEGVGTTFKIYLPRVIAEIDSLAVSDISAEMPVGNETILLVEDEEIVRNLSKVVLQECGYTVVEARNGLEALEIFENREHEFDLLLTDVVMPRMGGRELSEKLVARMPNLQILFTSGYTGDAVVRHGVIEANTNFIQKPFTPESLASKVRSILDKTD